MYQVFIDGSEGTTGLKIRERLSARDDVALIPIPESLRKDPSARRERINAADFVFLCLPDAAAEESVSLCENPHTRIIDASTAHRTHPDWAYGFAELSALHRKKIQTGTRIAVPGCHASGFIALLYPLTAAGLLPADMPLVCHSLTGYSGGGKKMIAQYEADTRPDALDSPRQYGLTQLHKHLKEMQIIPGLADAPAFSPIVADFYSGMEVTVPIFSRLLTRKMGVDAMRALFQAHYAGQKLVHIAAALPEDNMLAANTLAGRDDMEITVCGNDERILLVARFDNLGKGASGAAIECFNIATGADDAEGLIC